MNPSTKEIITASALGIAGKLLGAVVNFISLPILLRIYGKEGYGLIGIAISVNAFAQIIALGTPTGAVKFFSEWIETENFDELKKGMQSSTFFFTIVGLCNSFILLALAVFGKHLFSVKDFNTLSHLLIVVALTVLPVWFFLPLQHLLMASEKMLKVNIANSLASILNLFATLATLMFHVHQQIYLAIYFGTNLIVIPMNLAACKNLNFFRPTFLAPILHVVEFKKIFRYSLNLFGMAILQFFAITFQPLILVFFTTNGEVLVSDYKILQNITLLISMAASIFLQNFIPLASKLNLRGDKGSLKSFVFSSTKWLSIGIFFICALIAFQADDILKLYVHNAGLYLGKWLAWWMVGLLFLNNQAVAAIIFAAGNFRLLKMGVFIGTVACLLFSICFVHSLGVGVVPISFLIYKFIEAIFLYAHYLPKTLGLKWFDLVLNCMTKPLFASCISVLICYIIINSLGISSVFFRLLLTSVLGFVIYVVFVWQLLVSPSEKNVWHNAVNKFKLIFNR